MLFTVFIACECECGGASGDGAVMVMKKLLWTVCGWMENVPLRRDGDFQWAVLIGGRRASETIGMTGRLVTVTHCAALSHILPLMYLKPDGVEAR